MALLPKLSAQSPIARPGSLQPTTGFLNFMEETRRAQLETDAGQQALIDALAAQLELIVAVQEAQAVQLDRLNRSLISTSHANGLTISAEADGATARATISDHVRVYVDGTVSVTGGARTALDYGTQYAFYYDDEEREGGAVDFLATTDATAAVTSSANPYRHFIGVVMTPATSGDPPTDGGGSLPPGFPPGGIYREEMP